MQSREKSSSMIADSIDPLNHWSSSPAKTSLNSSKTSGMYSTQCLTDKTELENLKGMMEAGLKQRLKQIAKLLLVLLLPISTLIIFSGLQTASAIREERKASNAIKIIREYFRIDRLISDLQVERGITSSFISSNNTNLNAHLKMMAAKNTTDKSIFEINSWPYPGLEVKDKLYARKEDLHKSILNFRSQPNNNVNDTMFFFTEIIESMIAWTASFVELTIKVDHFDLVSSHALLSSGNEIGLQRGFVQWKPDKYFN